MQPTASAMNTPQPSPSPAPTPLAFDAELLKLIRASEHFNLEQMKILIIYLKKHIDMLIIERLGLKDTPTKTQKDRIKTFIEEIIALKEFKGLADVDPQLDKFDKPDLYLAGWKQRISDWFRNQRHKPIASSLEVIRRSEIPYFKIRPTVTAYSVLSRTKAELAASAQHSIDSLEEHEFRKYLDLLVNLTSQITAKDAFIRDNDEAIKTLTKIKLSTMKTPNQLGAWQAAVADLWKDADVDLWEAKAAGNGNIAENQGNLGKCLFHLTHLLTRSGRFGPLEMVVTYGYREDGSDKVIVKTIEAHGITNLEKKHFIVHNETPARKALFDGLASEFLQHVDETTKQPDESATREQVVDTVAQSTSSAEGSTGDEMDYAPVMDSSTLAIASSGDTLTASSSSQRALEFENISPRSTESITPPTSVSDSSIPPRQSTSFEPPPPADVSLSNKTTSPSLAGGPPIHANTESHTFAVPKPVSPIMTLITQRAQVTIATTTGLSSAHTSTLPSSPSAPSISLPPPALPLSSHSPTSQKGVPPISQQAPVPAPNPEEQAPNAMSAYPLDAPQSSQPPPSSPLSAPPPSPPAQAPSGKRKRSGSCAQTGRNTKCLKRAVELGGENDDRVPPVEAEDSTTRKGMKRKGGAKKDGGKKAGQKATKDSGGEKSEQTTTKDNGKQPPGWNGWGKVGPGYKFACEKEVVLNTSLVNGRLLRARK